MEIRTLQKAIHEWKREDGVITAIKISPKEFHELASDKKANEHLELFVDGERIIGHKFDGIPMVIMREVETFEIV